MSDTEEETTRVKRVLMGASAKLDQKYSRVNQEGESYLDPEHDPSDILASHDLDLDQINDNLQDYDDNLSLEVNFGDGSSCRASDVSSLSFQNIVLDDPDTVDSETVELVTGSRRDSDESGDSIPNDFMLESESQTFSGALEDEIRRKSSYHERAQISDEEDCTEDSSYNTGTMKRKSKLSVASSGGKTEGEDDNDTGTGSGSTQCNDQNHCSSGGACGTPTSEAKSVSEAVTSPNGSGSDVIHDVIPAALAAVMARGSVPPPICSYSPDGRLSGSASSSVSVDGEPVSCSSIGVGMPASTAGIDAKINSTVSANTPASPITTTFSGITTGTAASSTTSSTTNTSTGPTSCSTASSDPGGQTQHVTVKKRNSAEIRNNIPNVNEVKSYDTDTGLDVLRYQSQGAVPKMRKKSPGLARRLGDGPPDRPSSDRDTSSSEKETDPNGPIDTSVISAQRMFESQLRNGNTSALATLQMSKPALPQVAMGGAQNIDTDQVLELTEGRRLHDPTRKNIDIENEYDYVKYARIQHGDSYVGMRLAYSSSNDSLNFKNRMQGSDEDHFLSSSREMSPEKAVQSNHNSYNDQIRTKVNEDSLTEIPLNGSDQLQSEEKKDFSLSPEATECDSAEVESVISEEGKSSTSGMPMVEDGLSSSQGSDTEDACTMDNHRPTEILKRKFKSEIEQELNNHNSRREEFDEGGPLNLPRSSGSSSRQSDMSASDVERQREAVDMAIQDIKSAIEKSKNTMLKSPHQDQQPAEEPVWVMR